MPKNFQGIFRSLMDVGSRFSFTRELITDMAQKRFANSLRDQEYFDAVVLQSDLINDDGRPTTADFSAGTSIRSPSIWRVYVRPLDIHDLMIPEPCKFKDQPTRDYCISLHPVAMSEELMEDGAANHSISPGDIVRCTYKSGPDNRKGMRGLRFNPNRVGVDQDGQGKIFNCGSKVVDLINFSADGSQRFPDTSRQPVTETNENDGPPGTPCDVGENKNKGKSRRWRRRVWDLAHDLPCLTEYSSTNLFEVPGFPEIEKYVTPEHDYWSGKLEQEFLPNGQKNKKYKKRKTEDGNKGRDKEMKERLSTYWAHAGHKEAGLNHDKDGYYPWSAVYVSYILRDAKFIPGWGHHKYAKSNKDTEHWKLFSLMKNYDKIKIQLGDILIKPRYGISDGAPGDPNHSHGDCIYKIDEKGAHASGGNVKNTAKRSATFKLNPDGTLVHKKGSIKATNGSGPYILILRKIK